MCGFLVVFVFDVHEFCLKEEWAGGKDVFSVVGEILKEMMWEEIFERKYKRTRKLRTTRFHMWDEKYICIEY